VSNASSSIAPPLLCEYVTTVSRRSNGRLRRDGVMRSNRISTMENYTSGRSRLPYSHVIMLGNCIMGPSGRPHQFSLAKPSPSILTFLHLFSSPGTASYNDLVQVASQRISKASSWIPELWPLLFSNVTGNGLCRPATSVLAEHLLHMFFFVY
jgi:hypothetical protein